METTDEATAPSLREKIIAALKEIRDPDLGMNVYDLGLIYEIAIDDTQNVSIQMTLTSPGCPYADMFLHLIHQGVSAIETVKNVKIDLVWEPAWTMDRLTEQAKLELGLL